MEIFNMFKPGDKFIHFTKYGGVNRGEVQRLHSITVWDTKNLCKYEVISIFTTKGVKLNLDGTDGLVYKVESEMDSKEAYDFNQMMEKVTANKVRPSNKKIHVVDEN